MSSAELPLPRFKLDHWSAVAVWSWDIAVDNCAICRNHIMDKCIECQDADDADKPARSDCRVSWGECNHAFHRHCIRRWLRTRDVCPLDNGAWVFSIPNDNEASGDESSQGRDEQFYDEYEDDDGEGEDEEGEDEDQDDGSEVENEDDIGTTNEDDDNEDDEEVELEADQ